MTAVLCVDIGNTYTVLGLVRDGKVLKDWRLATDERRTADEWGALLGGLLREGLDGQRIEGVCVCATVPAVLVEWRRMLPRRLGELPVVVVEPGIRTGIPVRVDNPREVGADRIVNALAAAHFYDGPTIVVGFGTATTYDVVDQQGSYVGGVIAPGLEISLEALGRRGAQLRQVEITRPRQVIAKNTVEALQSGLVHGFAAQVDGLVARILAELGARLGDANVVATGSMAAEVIAECSNITEHRPGLTLQGLELVFDRNVAV